MQHHFLKFLLKKTFCSSLLLYYKVVKLKKIIYSYLIKFNLKKVGKNVFIPYLLQIKGAEYITVGNNIGLGENGILTAWDTYYNQKFNPEICMGNNIWIGENFHITAINKIVIGDNFLAGKCITITDNSHGKFDEIDIYSPPSSRELYSKGPVIIGENVWVGDKVTILSGVKIGKNCIIGANSVVTKTFPANSLVAGNPAVIIKQL